MIDFTDFKKYKIIYLLVILLFALLFAIRDAPLYHAVFVDITVEPPESVRSRDFSWIAVNGWFITQTRLIKNDVILEGVKSDISKQKLKKIVSANRIGASNIIRISICSDEDLAKLKSLVSDIANLYLNQLDKPGKETDRLKKADQTDRKRTHDALLSDRMRIKEEIGAINKRLKDYEIELTLLGAKPIQLRTIKERIEEIDKTLVSLKTELVNLRLVYTDNWPQTSRLKNQIDTLEIERQKVDSGLPAAQKLEGEKADIISNIDKDKKDAEILQNELKATDNRLGQIEQEDAVKQQDVLKKKAPSGCIITAPTQNTQKIFPILGMRLLIATVIGVIFWFLMGLILKNAYLFWILKDRLFKKR